MLCIVAFGVVLVLSAVSAKYRKLLGRAWGCVWRRVTFRPCDTTFREDVKNSLLAPLAVRNPRLVKPASIAIEVVAWLMVLSLVVSLYILGRSGVNLFVYGTCDKENGQSCSLAAEMCSVDSGTPDFWESIGQGDVVGAFGNEFTSLGGTIAAVPSRLRTWDAAEYATADATYLHGRREGNPVALEILDPGCRFCAQLFRNMAESGFDDAHDLTYLVYPIETDEGPKFANSPLVARTLTAARLYQHEHGVPDGVRTADWHILTELFTGTAPNGRDWQSWVNAASSAEARAQLRVWLAEAGLDSDQVAAVQELADSDEVAGNLARVRETVEHDVRTVAIPTLIAGGGLHSGLVGVDTLGGLD